MVIYMARPGGFFRKGNLYSVGRPNPVAYRMITQVLISQLNEIDPKTQKPRLHKIVENLIKAAEGYTKDVIDSKGKKTKEEVPFSLEAIREIIDRIDGKPKQNVEGSGHVDEDRRVTGIVHVIVDPGQDLSGAEPPRIVDATPVPAADKALPVQRTLRGKDKR
jgi:hypothetical protein